MDEMDEKQNKTKLRIKIIIICYSAFLGTQSILHSKGESPHPPPVCSIHLDDATAAIVRQIAHHTPAYWWRGDRVMKPISVCGWLEVNLQIWPGYQGYTPFSKEGFLMTTESQDLGLTSHPKDGDFPV